MNDGPVVSQADARAWSSLTGIAQIIDCPPASVAALPEARRPPAVQCSGRLIRLAALVQRLAEVRSAPVVVLPWHVVLSLRRDLLTPTLDLYTSVACSGHHGRHAERPPGNDNGRYDG
jgi:hypothetical protein